MEAARGNWVQVAKHEADLRAKARKIGEPYDVEACIERIAAARKAFEDATEQAILAWHQGRKKPKRDLVETLQGENRNVRSAAKNGMRHIGPKAKAALTEVLTNPDREIRCQAVVSLSRVAPSLMGFEVKLALPALIEALQGENRNVRSAAVQLLGSMEVDFSTLIPAVTDVLKHEDSDVRLVAVRLLESRGMEAGDAVPDLKVALADENMEVRVASIRALSRIMGSAAIPALTEMLNHEDLVLSGMVKTAIRSIGSD